VMACRRTRRAARTSLCAAGTCAEAPQLATQKRVGPENQQFKATQAPKKCQVHHSDDPGHRSPDPGQLQICYAPCALRLRLFLLTTAFTEAATGART